MKQIVRALPGVVAGAVVGCIVAGSVLRGQPQPEKDKEKVVVVPKELSSYRDIAKKVLPAVVSIEALTGKEREKEKAPRPNPLRDVPVGFGSGCLIDPTGVVLTNYHVIEGADLVEVTLNDGKKVQSRKILTDPKTDVGVIRLELKDPVPFLELGDSAAMEIGDRVLAVGAPFGLTGSVTAGIVSAKSRAINANLYEDFLQTDAAVNPGSSGGPLVNLEGKVIGINAAIKSRSGGSQGVGLAVSSDLARDVVKQLLETGSVRRGYLGVQVKEVTSDEVAKLLGMPNRDGVVVSRVTDRGPAAKAGLEAGDVIVAINRVAVKDSREVQLAVARHERDKPAEFLIYRDGKLRKLDVTLEEQPRDYANPRVPLPRLPDRLGEKTRVDRLGAEAVDLTDDLADPLGYPAGTKGAVIVRVQRDGPAALAELKPGMLVIRVGTQPVKTAAELQSALTDADLTKGVLLRVQSPQGGTDYALLKTP